MSKVITPTIGRQVWFWLTGAKRVDAQSSPTIQPEAATVTYVHGDRMVNLQVINANGEPRSVCSVPLVQPEDPWSEYTGMHCQWMPFQVGQAKALTPPPAHPAS